ncbi:MAG TPA: glutaminase A [Gemmatimonadaceae bacterium]
MQSYARPYTARRLAIAVAVVAVAAVPLAAQTPDEYQRAVNAAYERYKNLNDGKNADFIPALAKVDPKTFGIALVTPNGKVYLAGDVTSEVSIQSISKVFTMAKVMEQSGERPLADNVGVDATGQPSASIVAIEQHKGGQMNPLVNPGAIATTSMIAGNTADEVWTSIMNTLNAFAGRELRINQDVYKSETDYTQRNQAMAMLMHAYGRIKSNPMQATDIFMRQSSVNVNARDLAIMAATLANGGKNPVSNRPVVSPEHVPAILAVMATAGLYDDSGKWLYTTGLPAKSGIGGGLIAVSPGKFGVAVVSPPLDSAGISVRGQKAIADISTALGGNPYAVQPRPTISAKR